jgi:predicted permease
MRLAIGYAVPAAVETMGRGGRGMGVEIRRALRALVRTPGSSGIAVAVLALGIGLSAFMFSMIWAVFGRGLGLPEESRLVALEVVSQESRLRTGRPAVDLAAPLAGGVAGAEVASYEVTPMNLVADHGPFRLEVTHLTPNGFPWVAGTPVVGRLPVEADLRATETPIVLSHRAWLREFGGREDAIGTRLTSAGRPMVVVGVMERDYAFPQTAEAWTVLDPAAVARGETPGGRVEVLFRLDAGANLDVLEQALEARAIAAREAAPGLPTDLRYETTTLIERYTGREMFYTLLAMAAAVALVLLVACANVANLLLARASQRTAEVGIRTALGGGRLRAVLPFFLEALLLGALGAMVGIAGVVVGMDALSRTLTTEAVGKPYFIRFAVDGAVLAFTLTLSVGVALLAAVGPAIRASRVSPRGVLAEGGRGGGGMRMSGLMSGLVVAEVALSAVVLVGAGVTTRSMFELSQVDFGFEPDAIAAARIDLVGGPLEEIEARHDLVRRLAEGLAGDPDLAFATVTRTLPGTEALDPRIEVEGADYPSEQDMPRGSIMRTTAGFFGVTGGGITEGRDFEVADFLPGADPVVLIDEPLAAALFPGGRAIGRRLRVPGGWFGLEGWFRIVGVVPDAMPQGLEPGAEPGGVYFPITASDPDLVYLLARTPGRTPEELVPALRRAVESVDPTLPVTMTGSLGGRIEQGLWFYRVFGSLFSWFGVAALVMSALGLYAVLSFSVTRRSVELGIRIALGAETGRLVSLVSRQAGRLVLLGLTVGLALGWLSAGAIRTLAFRTDPRDPLIYLAVVAIIVVVASLATAHPLRRAVRTHPVDALRSG